MSTELVSIPLGVSDANAPLTTSWTLQAEFVKVAQKLKKAKFCS